VVNRCQVINVMYKVKEMQVRCHLCRQWYLVILQVTGRYKTFNNMRCYHKVS